MKNMLLFAMALAVVISCTLEKTMPASDSSQVKTVLVDEKQKELAILP